MQKMILISIVKLLQCFIKFVGETVSKYNWIVTVIDLGTVIIQKYKSAKCSSCDRIGKLEYLYGGMHLLFTYLIILLLFGASS